jgi:hypothetical protein
MSLRRSPHLFTHGRSEGRQMTSKGRITKGLRRRAARGAMALAVLSAVAAVMAPMASAIEFSSLGSTVDNIAGQPERQAGSHPDIAVNFGVVQQDPANPESFPVELPHRFQIELPPGLVGNPFAASFCPESGLKGAANGNGAVCPVDSQVGIAHIGAPGTNPLEAPVYNIEAPKGSPAAFAFNVLGSIVRLTPSVRPGDYGITIDSGPISQGIVIPAAEVVLWGVPADPVHNFQRYGPILGGLFYAAPAEPEGPRQAFLSTPTSCPGTPEVRTARVDGWKTIDQFDTESFSSDVNGVPFVATGCDKLDFSPTIEARPTTNLGDSPSGLEVDLHVPQNTDPDGLSEANVKNVSLTLPAGMTVNPSSANGLGACTTEQIGLTTPVGQEHAVFDGAAATCPDASKLGSVEVDTPLIDHPLPGAIYLASQGENPFGSLLALYIAIEDPQSGVTVKLAGHPQPDPQTGQLTVSFDQNPQLPFEDLKVKLFTGPRAALKTPLACGEFKTTSDLTPWTSPEGADATPSDGFKIVQGAGASACVKAESEAANKPSFSAGTVDPTAGAFSPFVLKIGREDGTQPIKAIDATLPKGLLGKLAGIPYCSDSALAAAAAHSGKAEQASPSCPAASQIGTVKVGAGAGSEPFYAPGTAYLAGPYKGAPLSLAIVTPAVAGPFDLGDVVVRTALNVDPESTQIHAVSDPIPTILQGIPLDVRSIALTLDRPSFTLNPTSCTPSTVGGSVTSVFDQSAALSSPFQVGGCNALGFSPKLSLSLNGPTKRGKWPQLRAVLQTTPGQANISKVSVALPHSEFLEQNHIRTVCTRVQFAAAQCPAGSIYGEAIAYSPLLDQPLEGPVYLRSSSNKLPDLVAALHGQINVVLDGRIDSFHKGIRTTFEMVPDAPVSKFVLNMQGGKKSLLVNSRDICQSTGKATIEFTGQNGKTASQSPALAAKCGKKAKKAKAKKAKKKPAHRGGSSR